MLIKAIYFNLLCKFLYHLKSINLYLIIVTWFLRILCLNENLNQILQFVPPTIRIKWMEYKSLISLWFSSRSKDDRRDLLRASIQTYLAFLDFMVANIPNQVKNNATKWSGKNNAPTWLDIIFKKNAINNNESKKKFYNYT